MTVTSHLARQGNEERERERERGGGGERERGGRERERESARERAILGSETISTLNIVPFFY